MDAVTILPGEGETSPGRLQCMQVWGGSRSAETSVATTGLDVWLYSAPYGDASAGGDVYYLSSCSSGRITRLVLADVCGHGSRVAEVAAVLRRLMQLHINRIDQATLVDRINEDFVEIGDPATFATALIGTYFLPTGTLTVTNAGHPPPLFYSAGRGVWTAPAPRRAGRDRVDLPLGMFPRTSYEQLKVRFARGDRVLWLTDGLLEADDERGEMLGTEGVVALLNELRTDRIERVIPDLVDRIRRMSPGNLEQDDTTAMVLTPNARTVSMRDNLLAPFRFVSQAIRRLRSVR